MNREAQSEKYTVAIVTLGRRTCRDKKLPLLFQEVPVFTLSMYRGEKKFLPTHDNILSASHTPTFID